MSIATDAKVRDLERRVALLENSKPPNSPSLVERYMQKFGKKPHHFMKEESIRKAVA